MTETAQNPAHNKMDELRQRYIDQIASLRDTMQYYLHLEAMGEMNAASRQKLARTAHKIAGSGGTYGFARLSAAARRVEQLAEEPPKTGKQLLRHALVALLTEIDDLSVVAPEAPRRPLGEPPHPVKSEHRPAAQPAPETQAPPAPDTGDETEQAGAPAPAPAEPVRTPLQPAPRPRIYIVEDDEVIADLLKGLLKEEFDVTVDPDGADAEAAIGAERADLVILDDQLPERAGVEILHALQADRRLRNIPTVMITATTDPANVLKALDAGAANYFTKPFDAEGVLDYIRFVLSTAQDTVMIVDDDPAVRDLLAQHFQNSGLRTVEADSGINALRMLRDITPGLVVLDRAMPGVDGGPVLNELRRTPQSRKIPVIMLTSPKSDHDALDWLRRGAVDFVAKPFNADEVVLRGLRAMGREA